MNLRLIRLCEVAFDGTRVKASNGRFRTQTAASLEKKLRALDELSERLLSECKAADEEAAMAGSPTRLPEEVAAAEKRRERIAAALELARAADKARKKNGINPEKRPAQVPMTDLDSRSTDPAACRACKRRRLRSRNCSTMDCWNRSIG